jgi:hypothetical protein
MKKGVHYIVKYGSTLYNDQDFEWIGDGENLKLWMSDDSLREGDEIYEVKLVGKIMEKKELELIKAK